MTLDMDMGNSHHRHSHLLDIIATGVSCSLSNIPILLLVSAPIGQLFKPRQNANKPLSLKLKLWPPHHVGPLWCLAERKVALLGTDHFKRRFNNQLVDSSECQIYIYWVPTSLHWPVVIGIQEMVRSLFSGSHYFSINWFPRTLIEVKSNRDI